MHSLLKRPSAWIPIALSLIALAMILIRIAVFGVPVREPDEGTAAHLFQIWFVLQVLSMAFFAVSWLRQRPLQTLFVLAIQIVAALAACAPVFYLNL